MSITNCDEFYLKKYDKFLSIIVNKFIAKGRGSSSNIKEDLLQEARLAFLKWIRSQTSSDYIEISKSIIAINHALYEYVTLNTGVHMRKHQLKEYYEKYTVVSLEEWDQISENTEDYDYSVDFKKWRDTLDKKQKKIVDMKMRGYKTIEIAKMLHVSQPSITKILCDSIRPSYNAYFNPPAA